MKKIVRFIYESALSMIEPWDDEILEAITRPLLTNDGFQIVAPPDSQHYVGMREYRGTIFVSVHASGVNYSSIAHDQKLARSFYDKVVNDLLVA